MKEKHIHRSPWTETFSHWVTEWSGSTGAFFLAVAVIVVWGITGPFFDYSDTWQLVINTGTTIVTFLMVFLIQRSQNKDTLAVQIKLNEILAALQGASNRLINVEDMTEQEMRDLHQRYKQLVDDTVRKCGINSVPCLEEEADKNEKS